MNILLRTARLILSCLTLLKFKLYYGPRFQFMFSDRIAPSVKIRLNNGGSFKMGKNVCLKENVIINCTGGRVVLKNNVFLNDMVCLNSREQIIIGDRTVIGQATKIYDHDHDYKHNMQNDYLNSA